jgi:hypothetical protein
MTKIRFAAALAAAALASSAPATAQQFATMAEARAMLDRAVTEFKANGAAALAKFNDKDNKQLRDRDLYVFCFNMSDGKLTAHANPTLVNTDIRGIKVADDPLGQRIFDAAREGTLSTVSYNLRHAHGRADLRRRLLQIAFENAKALLGSRACAGGGRTRSRASRRPSGA